MKTFRQGAAAVAFRLMLIGLAAWSLGAAPAAAQAVPDETSTTTTTAAAAASAAVAGDSFFEIVLAGGWVGLLIILLSVAAVALVVEHLWTIRGPVLMPPGLAEGVRDALRAGQLDQAAQQCKLYPSALAFVISAGLSETDAGWPAVEKAVEEALAEQSARLYRKIEYLSVIGNIAPMLGLLGTVIGMIFAFREVAATQGAARAADLAQGIYLALVTTVEGLVVAIPSLAAFAVFRNRVDQLVAEAAYLSQQVFAPLRRRAAARTSPPAPGGR